MREINDWAKENREILIASDHGGLPIKDFIKSFLKENHFLVNDLGPYILDPDDDYPDYAGQLCREYLKGKARAGILVCRSGAGMLINANRFHGIRAVLGFDAIYAKQTRDHNCSNILVIPGDFISREKTMEIVSVWLTATFSNDARHICRLEKLEDNSIQ